MLSKASRDEKGRLTKCENINECQNKDPVCSTHANCTDTIGKYLCTCWPTYYGNGIVCHRENMHILGREREIVSKQLLFAARGVCEPSCHENAFCEEFGETYRCKCKTGYTGDGKTCTCKHK